MSCTHDWQPVDGWYARYRCPLCGVFGLKERLVNEGEKGALDFSVRPYQCAKTVNGTRCGKPAIGKTFKSRAWRCSEHKEKA